MHQILCQEFNQENSHHFNENTDQYDLQTNVSAWWRNLYQGNLSEIMIWICLRKFKCIFPKIGGFRLGAFYCQRQQRRLRIVWMPGVNCIQSKHLKGCSQNRENRASRKLLALGSTCRRSCWPKWKQTRARRAISIILSARLRVWRCWLTVLGELKTTYLPNISCSTF